MQTTNHILLVKPHHFSFNTETAGSNAFQNVINDKQETIKQNVLTEFENFSTILRSKGIHVTVVNDTPLPQKPDAVFPNNWASFHADGTVILYPMFAPNRRHERRQDIIEGLKKDFQITHVLDLSVYEKENQFLEGTGSIVFDHEHKIAYACLSPRTDKALFLRTCEFLKYKPVYFLAHDQQGKQIYHTNVMMCVAEKFAVVCCDCITNKEEREVVIQSLKNTRHELIDITFEQMNKFAGNMLELKSDTGKGILAMSQSAYDSLTGAQKKQIEQYCELTPLPITTIETIGGGSARCMIAEVFLQPHVKMKRAV
jgi:hypothetical protein